MAPEAKRLIASANFSPDVQEFIRILHKHKVAYVLVGGQAVIYHGHARFTGDVDFFYSEDSENSERLFKGLQEFWAGEIPGIHSAEELKEPVFDTFSHKESMILKPLKRLFERTVRDTPR